MVGRKGRAAIERKEAESNETLALGTQEAVRRTQDAGSRTKQGEERHRLRRRIQRTHKVSTYFLLGDPFF